MLSCARIPIQIFFYIMIEMVSISFGRNVMQL